MTRSHSRFMHILDCQCCIVLLRSSTPTPQWIASTKSPPPLQSQSMFSTVSVKRTWNASQNLGASNNQCCCQSTFRQAGRVDYSTFAAVRYRVVQISHCHPQLPVCYPPIPTEFWNPATITDYGHFTYETLRPLHSSWTVMDSSPTAQFTYSHHKNTYPATHTAAISIVIMEFLLYIV